MKMKAMIAVSIAVACAMGASAVDTRDYSTYIKLKSNTAIAYQVGGWPAASAWNPAGEMTDEGYYLIPSGKTLTSTTNTGADSDGNPYPVGGTWPMAEMAIEGTFTVSASGGRQRAAVTPRLALLPGGKISIGSAYGTINGTTLDIRGTAANPSLITYGYSNSGDKPNYYPLLNIAFTGDEDGVVKFSYSGTGNYSIFQRAFRVTGGFANFLGTVIVDGADTWLRPQSSATTFDIGGTLWVTNGASLYIATVSPTFGSLVLASDTTLQLNGGKFVTVTNTFSMAEGVKIIVDSIETTAFTYDTGAGYTPPEIPVLSVCGAANAAAVDRDALLAAIKAGSGKFKSTLKNGIPRLVLAESVRADGGVDFKVSHSPIVKQLTGCSSGRGPYGYEEYEDYLSDGQAISPLKDYYVPSQSVYFNSPARSSYVFPGRSLTIYLGAGGRNIGFYPGDNIVISNLYVIGENINSRFRQMGKDGNAWLSGNATFYDFANFRVQGSGVFHLLSDMSGDAVICETLDIGKLTEKNSAWLGTLSLEGDNSAFAGKFFVGCGRAAADDEGLTNLTLRVAAGMNLGGALDAFAFDAVKISEACTLAITDTATFNAVNRGWCLMDGAMVDIASGKEATVGETITFGGTSEKKGAGTLILGGGAKFYDSANDEATDTPNGASFRIAEGALGVTSASALDGVDLAFATGTKLLVFPETDGLALASAPTIEGGTLEVTVENLADFDAGTVNILTLPSSVPFDTSKLAVRGRNGYRINPVTPKTVGDRTVYCASFSKIGFSLTIR